MKVGDQVEVTESLTQKGKKGKVIFSSGEGKYCIVDLEGIGEQAYGVEALKHLVSR